jgi:putative DNA primase/helicase
MAKPSVYLPSFDQPAHIPERFVSRTPKSGPEIEGFLPEEARKTYGNGAIVTNSPRQYQAIHETFKNEEVVTGRLTGSRQPLDPMDATEDGIARELAKRFRDDLRYDHDVEEWFEWSGSVWVKDQTNGVIEYLRQIVRGVAIGRDGRDRASMLRASFIRGAEGLARGDAQVSVRSAYWDQDPCLLGCPTVTVDLRTGEQLAPDPGYAITKLCSVDPHDAACPNWERFLSDATGDDEEVIAFLQAWFGYQLTGLTHEQSLLFIHGPGGNGKSVFLNVMKYVLGQYCVTAANETFTKTRYGQHPTELAMLQRARAVFVSETEEGQSWASARIKLVTGGDLVTARYMRKDFFTFRPEFKLTIVGNHPPSLSDVDPAIRRRFLILEFSRQPKVVDPDLEAKLLAEAPQILAWAIRGCREFLENGLPRPQAVLKATNQYFEDQDTFQQWLAECCILGVQDKFTSAKDLFGSWREYCEMVGEAPGSSKLLGQKLGRLGLSSGQKRLSTGNSKIWYGIALTGCSEE